MIIRVHWIQSVNECDAIDAKKEDNNRGNQLNDVYIKRTITVYITND